MKSLIYSLLVFTLAGATANAGWTRCEIRSHRIYRLEAKDWVDFDQMASGSTPQIATGRLVEKCQGLGVQKGSFESCRWGEEGEECSTEFVTLYYTLSEKLPNEKLGTDEEKKEYAEYFCKELVGKYGDCKTL